MANWTLSDLLIVASAHEIKDGDVIFAGVGKPVLSALLAKMTFAPNAIICTESGSIGPMPSRLMLGIGDNAGVENCFCCTSLWRLFADQQKGYVDIGMLGGAQVDKYGNLNSTEIFGEDGDYYHPKIRFTGSGGANDIANSALRTVISMPMQKGKFVNKIDYITSPGWLDGGDSRKKAGLTQGGPSAIITDKCILRFTMDTHEMILTNYHPGVTVEEIKSYIPWDLKIAKDLCETPVPTQEECEIIRKLDPDQYYTGDGLKKMTFENYMEQMEKFYEEKMLKMQY